MFTSITQRNEEMSHLNELSHIMDQFLDLSTEAHSCLSESHKPVHTAWQMFSPILEEQSKAQGHSVITHPYRI